MITDEDYEFVREVNRKQARLLEASREEVEELGKRIDHSSCHDGVCNCNTRKHPRGAKGVSCSCANRQKRERKELLTSREEVRELEAKVE